MVSIPLGMATTIAVLFHEIPQEIGDFGSLIYGGFARAKALLYNFLTALSAILGAVIVLILGPNFAEFSNFLVPFAAGGFIYIAGSDLIPELHKSNGNGQSVWQLFYFLAGIGIMLALMFFE
jgi:zinc and cadmium transporter